MQKEIATIEQVAQDNHERARRLMKELGQMQQEYLELQKQVRASPGSRRTAQVLFSSQDCRTAEQGDALELKALF